MRWTELMQQQDAFAAAIRKEDGISFVGDPYVKGFHTVLIPTSYICTLMTVIPAALSGCT